jgi:hypothetical protein
MATAPWQGGPVTVDERYESASNTSDLTVGGGMIPKDHRTSQGDVVLAAGMSESRVGMALLRLHSEWTASAKPRRVDRHGIERLTALIRASDAKAKKSAERRGVTYDEPGSATKRAHDEAHRWYRNELKLLAGRLKTRSLVLEQLCLWGATKGIGPDVVCAAVHHWLDHICPVCDGHGLRYLENQSARQCGECYGTGETPRPEGSGRVLAHIDYVLGVARGSLRKRLRG